MVHGYVRALVVLATAALASVGAVTGCSSPPPANTEVEFEEVVNLGYSCGGPLTSWTVTARETGDNGTAGCEQPVLFPNLAPDAVYTFDIQGFNGQTLCWQGSCQVQAAGYTTTFADCSSAIVHLCNL